MFFKAWINQPSKRHQSWPCFFLTTLKRFLGWFEVDMWPILGVIIFPKNRFFGPGADRYKRSDMGPHEMAENKWVCLRLFHPIEVSSPPWGYFTPYGCGVIELLAPTEITGFFGAHFITKDFRYLNNGGILTFFLAVWIRLYVGGTHLQNSLISYTMGPQTYPFRGFYGK